MQCQLCLKDFKQLANAHLVPKCFIKKLPRNKKGQLAYFSKDKSKFFFRQDGEIDKTILCKKCDNLIGNYDNYASKLFQKSSLINVTTKKELENNQTRLVYNNINYQNLKLFFISLIWRCGISKRESCNQVDLGPKIQEEMRKMLIENQPGNQMRFPTIMMTFSENEKYKKINFIEYPSKNRMHAFELKPGGKVNGTTIFYLMMINTYKIFFFPSKINNKTMAEVIKQNSVDEGGKMKVYHFVESDAEKELLQQEKFNSLIEK